MFLDGQKGPIRIKREWDEDAALDGSSVDVSAPGKSKQPLDSLGWTDVLMCDRPFLSYNEMGAMLDGKPSELYDAVAPVLGLEELSDAQKLVGSVLVARERKKTRLLEAIQRRAECDVYDSGVPPDLDGSRDRRPVTNLGHRHP